MLGAFFLTLISRATFFILLLDRNLLSFQSYFTTLYLDFCYTIVFEQFSKFRKPVIIPELSTSCHSAIFYSFWKNILHNAWLSQSRRWLRWWGSKDSICNLPFVCQHWLCLRNKRIFKDIAIFNFSPLLHDYVMSNIFSKCIFHSTISCLFLTMIITSRPSFFLRVRDLQK